MDFRGAGGVGSSVTCDVAGAYGGILNDIGSGISVIGLLGNDLLWGTANAFDWTEGTADATYAEYAEAYATAAAAVICSSTYAQVDVWEIWNEPNYTQFKLSPARYAKLLHRTVDKMSQTCSKAIISGGVNGYVDPVIGGPVRLAESDRHPYLRAQCGQCPGGRTSSARATWARKERTSRHVQRRSKRASAHLRRLRS